MKVLFPTMSRISLLLDSTPNKIPDKISFLNSKSSVVSPNTGLASFMDAWLAKMFSSIVAKYMRISAVSKKYPKN